MASPGQLSGVRAGTFSRLAFAAIRRLERSLSPEALYRVVAPFIHARTAIKLKRPTLALPACLRREGMEFVSGRAKRRGDRFSEVIEFFPDQLSNPKWRDRVEFVGLEHLEFARKNGKPVVLAFCHFGPFFLLRYWLRAAGFPVATVIRGRAEDRPAWKRLADERSPFASISTAFYQDQLRELVEFLEAGNPILIAMDVELGKQIEAPLDSQWRVQVASGPIRLAIRHEAELIPCIITDKGRWQFRIKLGPPVPQEILRTGQEAETVKHLIDAIIPEIRAHPEQCLQRVIDLFRPAAPSEKIPLTHADQMAAR